MFDFSQSNDTSTFEDNNQKPISAEPAPGKLFQVILKEASIVPDQCK